MRIPDYSLLSQKLRNVEFNLRNSAVSEYQGILKDDFRALEAAAQALRFADRRIRMLEAQLAEASNRVCATCKTKLKWRH